MMKQSRKHGIGRRILAGVIVLLVILGVGCFLYLSSGSYRPAETYRNADGTWTDTVPGIQRMVSDDRIIVMPEAVCDDAIVFYPGGKVAYEAYLPLMEAFAREGIASVLVSVPFDLAIFDMNAADGCQDLILGIDHWYLGGHSLGGVMAASYAAKHQDAYDGLIFLGSYTTADFSDSELRAISLYGSEDQVLNRNSYEKNRSNLPADFTEIVIEGGCHAYFGNYGVQKGDGEPTITREEQMEITAKAVAEWMDR